MTYLKEVLSEYLNEIKPQPKFILELGAGHGSTVTIHKWVKKANGRKKKNLINFKSLETDPAWVAELKNVGIDVEHCADIYEFLKAHTDITPDVLIVDNKPGESRQPIIELMKDRAKIIIVDDVEETFEPSASDYKYNFAGFETVEIFKDKRPAVAILSK